MFAFCCVFILPVPVPYTYLYESENQFRLKNPSEQKLKKTEKMEVCAQIKLD